MLRRKLLSLAISLGLQPVSDRAAAEVGPRIAVRSSSARNANGTTILVNSVTSLDSPFARWWDKGGRAYARSIGALDEYRIEQNEGTIEGVVKQIDTLPNGQNRGFVLNIDLGTRYSAKAVADACIRNQIYFVTHGLAPADIEPRNVGNYYVAHIGDDHEMAGFKTGEALISAAKAANCIVALGGPLGDPAATLRKAGLDRALRGANSRVADYWAADWDPAAAFDVTRYWLLHYRDEVSGIWAADDPMALGAIEALRVDGLAGKIPVTGIDGHPLALRAIQDGELVATVPRDAFYEGGIGLSLAHSASRGIIHPEAEPNVHREFYLQTVLVTRDSVDRFAQYRYGADPDVDWGRFWSRISRAVGD